MAFGYDSSIFVKTIADALGPDPSYGVGAGGWDNTGAGAFKVALFNDTHPGPDRTLATPTFGVAPWLASEAVDSGGSAADWPAGGMPLTGVNFDPNASGSFPGFPGGLPGPFTLVGVQFTADNTPTPAGGPVTLDDVWGDLLYFPADGVYPDQALAFHSFGGPQQVTAGLFTILWHAAGLMIVTVQATP
jgi:hypothetical protein